MHLPYLLSATSTRLSGENNNIGNDGREQKWIGEDVSVRVPVARCWLTLALQPWCSCYRRIKSTLDPGPETEGLRYEAAQRLPAVYTQVCSSLVITVTPWQLQDGEYG